MDKITRDITQAYHGFITEDEEVINVDVKDSEDVIDTDDDQGDNLSDIDNQVMAFLMQGIDPSEQDFSDWADEAGVDQHDAITAAIGLAAKMARLMLGGKSNAVKDVEYNDEQMQMGIEIEHEHTVDDDVAAKIARDHIAEIPDYYSRLRVMEAEAGKEGKPTEYTGNEEDIPLEGE